MGLAMRGVEHQPLEVGVDDKPLQQPLPHAVVAPAAETLVRGLPFSVTRGQIAPRGAGAKYPKHRVDETAVVVGDSSPLAAPAGQMRLYQRPFPVRYVVSIAR